jgi:hypothetical protein
MFSMRYRETGAEDAGTVTKSKGETFEGEVVAEEVEELDELDDEVEEEEEDDDVVLDLVGGARCDPV